MEELVEVLVVLGLVAAVVEPVGMAAVVVWEEILVPPELLGIAVAVAAVLVDLL